jgi:acetate kinase
MTVGQFDHMVNYESGLLGVSETSADLLVRESEDVGPAAAIALCCYQIKKCIGSYDAALGGARHPRIRRRYRRERADVRVIPIDEELMIAKSVIRVLA